MRTPAVFVLMMVMSFIFGNVCIGTQVTESLATRPARRPQMLLAGNKLLLVWVTPLRIAPDTGMLTDDYMQMNYAVIAEKEKPLPKYPLKGKVLSVPSRSIGKFTFYRITQDLDNPGNIFLVDIYDDGYNARSGFDVHVRKVVYNDGNNTLAVNNMIFRFPPRKPDDEYGESHRVADGFPVISYVEPCIVVNSDHWRLSYLSREIPQDGGGVFTSDSIDGGKTWGAVSCIKQGCAQLQAFGAYGETSYIASVIYEENWPQLPIGRVLRGWPDDEYDKNTERDYIPYSGKLWITKINANIGKPFTQLIDQNEDVNGVAILALKNVVYIVYARGDSSKGSLWVVKSMGNDKWSKPAQLTADKKCLDREPCITQFNNEILVAYSRSYNGKASVIECIKISDILLQEDK